MPVVARLGFFLPVLVFQAPMSVVAFLLLFVAFLASFLLFIAFRCPSLLFLAFIALDINHFHRSRTGANE